MLLQLILTTDFCDSRSNLSKIVANEDMTISTTATFAQ